MTPYYIVTLLMIIISLVVSVIGFLVGLGEDKFDFWRLLALAGWLVSVVLFFGG